jgi:shikimate dehydrogenase
MTGKQLVDIDAEIERTVRMTIPEIFAKHGEDHFRKLETQMLAEFGQKSSLIIATGGGCVTRDENYPLLHQNGTIYWIQRDISELPTDGRPLSQANKLQEMYSARKPLYERFADKVVTNNGTAQQAADEIAKGWL